MRSSPPSKPASANAPPEHDAALPSGASPPSVPLLLPYNCLASSPLSHLPPVGAAVGGMWVSHLAKVAGHTEIARYADPGRFSPPPRPASGRVRQTTDRSSRRDITVTYGLTTTYGTNYPLIHNPTPFATERKSLISLLSQKHLRQRHIAPDRAPGLVGEQSVDPLWITPRPGIAYSVPGPDQLWQAGHITVARWATRSPRNGRPHAGQGAPALPYTLNARWLAPWFPSPSM